MQAKEVAQILCDNQNGKGSDWWWGECAYELAQDTPIPEGSFVAKCVEDFGGEGQGDQRYVVFEIISADGVQYFRKDGYYSSFEGTTWDGDFAEVRPVEKTITVYEDAVVPNTFSGSVESYDFYDSYDSYDSFLS